MQNALKQPTAAPKHPAKVLALAQQFRAPYGFWVACCCKRVLPDSYQSNQARRTS